MSLEIMHIDMDAFFAAVEQLDNLKLRGKPVIVGGVNLNERGVVATASYEAREYGVHSAMSLVEAQKLCPQGIFLQGRRERYEELSGQIFIIFQHFTPMVEKVSIDEAFLDLTGCHRLFGSSIEIGKMIKKEIKDKLGLIASVGLGPNKFLAKLASGLSKPDGFLKIEEDRINEILDPLPVGKIWGVGHKTEKILNKKGIKTIGMLKRLSQDELISIFGKLGYQLFYFARGIDPRQVESDNQIKSISQEETFADNLTDKDTIFAYLMKMADKVSRRLRQKGFKGSTVFVKIRYGDLTTYTRRVTLTKPINKMTELYQTGKSLLEKHRLLNKPVRLLGIGISNLTHNQNIQLSLFFDKFKEDELPRTIDKIKDRYGDSSIMRARNLEN